MVGSKSVKPRMLAPRLMNSILKYNAEKDWLSVCFLSEQNADQELISMWIVATLDIRELGASKKPSSSGCADSDRFQHAYWLSLTDGIMCAMMSNNSVTRYKMNPLLYKLLQEICARSKFIDEIAKGSRPLEDAAYYRLRVDTFRCVCAGVSAIWSEFTSSPGSRRHEFTQFRQKMMDTQRGVFAAVTEAYEINLRLVCLELDRHRPNWYRLSSRFLADFGSLSSGTTSWHASDDADQFSRHMDSSIEPLALLFKLMYDCVDALLYYCGEMAIGQQNVFFTIMELMFRQARCAEFPTAEKRIAWGVPIAAGIQHSFWLNGSERSLRSSGEKAHNLPGISPACAGFVESVRLFFAYQKYPSLIQWFAQTIDTYQTLRAGWPTSPLRVLLYNVVDPHGPLGLHSYYPMDEKANVMSFDVGGVRREAFYLACGLFHCKCTVSYEHSRREMREQLMNSLPSLRRFIVQDFVHELIGSTSAHHEDTLEAIIPVCQLIKAIAHHALIDSHRNLKSTGMSAKVLVDELRPTISHLFVIVTHVLEEDDSLRLSVSYVLLIELMRIVEELLSVNEVAPCQDLADIVHWGVRCAAVVYGILRRLSSSEVEVLFDKEAEDTPPSTLRREITTTIPCVCTKLETGCRLSVASLSRTSDDYGISKARARADLFGGIRRLIAKCRQTNSFEGIILVNF
ncbi:hypothetical protein PINS_up000298 [Pythium insidiosum]|nr:hypothetical protein PINS_up000298 [Pythium insidiosum]